MPRYALIVGISKYKSRHLRNLSKPAQDAQKIAAVLEKYGQFDTAPKVLHETVTYSELVEALRTFLEKKAVNGDALIYFTGHGISVPDPFDSDFEGYLSASDTEVRVRAGQVSPPENAISFTSLNKLIQKANLSSLVMLLDTCHSGDFIGKAAYAQSFSAMNKKSNCLLISACRDFEEALAKKSADHSLFTDAVLKALVPENADRRTGAITSGWLADELISTLKGTPQAPEAYGKGLGLKIIEFPPEVRVNSATPQTEQKSAVLKTQLSHVPRQMPPLPEHFVERPEKQQQVKADLLCQGTKVGTLVVSAIYGLGGIGKSVLATKLARDPDVQSHFADGILWVTLGQHPDILPLLSGWIQALGDNDYKPTAIESASNHLRTLLYEKCALLVVDDVWNPAHLEPFRVGSEGSCVLVTTREARISGAHLHQLDVMTPEQSLELMTQKLSEPLSETAKQQALSFAERVGHLPLALELAASQIEADMSWQELMEDFQNEVVRLETLDIYGHREMPDEEKRRQYSLLACFNLSLQQLSPEQLRQFAWLGVVPEDVSLTQEMAATLWQLTRRQASSILKTFRAKSLVLQGARQADERPSYRMHDLMHDLAQQLLTSPPQPLRDGELPGLGLTKAEAHSELLERYRKRLKGGQWHTLKDDGYIYAHLTWHIEQARQYKEVHSLLSASDESGRNGWYEACDRVGRSTIFTTDIGRAWRLSEQCYLENPSQSIVLQIRYALITSTLASIAQNIPSELIVNFVRKGYWTPAQGLAYIDQQSEGNMRAEAMEGIVPLLPEVLIPEAIVIAKKNNDDCSRAIALASLAASLSDSIKEDILNVLFSDDFYKTSKGLKLLAPYLSESLIKDTIARAIETYNHSSELGDWIEILSPYCTEPMLEELIDFISLDVNRFHASAIIQAIGPFASERLFQKIVNIVSTQLVDEIGLEYTIESIAPYAPLQNIGKLRDILTESYERKKIYVFRHGFFYTLCCLDICGQKEYFEEDFRQYLEHSHSSALLSDRDYHLEKLAPHLTLELFREAMKACLLETKEEHRIKRIKALVPSTPLSLRDEMISAINTLKEDRGYIELVVACIGANFPLSAFEEAIGTIDDIQNAEILLALLRNSQEKPRALIEKTFEVIQKMSDDADRRKSLMALSLQVPYRFFPQIISSVRLIHSEEECTIALGNLSTKSSHHSEAIFRMAWHSANHIRDEFSLVGYLKALSSVSPSNEKAYFEEAVSSARKIQDMKKRTLSLSLLVKSSSDILLSEVLTDTRNILNADNSDRRYCVQIFNVLSPHLSDDLFREVLSLAKSIDSTMESYNIGIVDSFVSVIPEKFFNEIIDYALSQSNEYYCERILRKIAPRLPKALFDTTLDRVMSSSYASSSWSQSNSRLRLLSALASQLSENIKNDVLDSTIKIEDDDTRQGILTNLIPYLSEASFPILLEEFSKVRNIGNETNFFHTLAAHLPDRFAEELLGRLSSMRYESTRARVVAELAPHLSESFPKVFEYVQSLEVDVNKATAMEACLSHLDWSIVSFSLWKEILRVLASQDRKSFLRTLPKLIPGINSLSEEDVLLETAHEVQRVCAQWL